MRILFLTAETCPTFRADVNVLFGNYLPRHGIYSDIVAGRTPGDDGMIVWGGGEAYLCDVSGGQAGKYFKTFLHGIRALFWADKTRYQAIQVRDMPVLAAFGLLAARLKGLNFYYWMSYPIPEGHLSLANDRGFTAGKLKFCYHKLVGHLGHFLLYQMVLPSADHIFVQTERMKEDMVAHGVASDKMTPVPMGVDLDAVRPEQIVPVKDQRLEGRRVLVYLGALDRVRKIEVLFDMLALVKQHVPNVLLLLVGDTQDDLHRAWLKQKTADVGVANEVIWTGWLSMQEGWRYVRSAEVGLSPIPRGRLLDVGSPTKVPEYLALGIPVVCNDNPDQQVVVSESGAGLCVPYTAQDFADAVMKIMEVSQPQGMAMIQSGKRYVAEHRDYKLLGNYLAQVYVGLAKSLKVS